MALWDSREHEVMLAGPADTGKTWAACRKLHADLLTHRGTQAVMVRKTLNSLYPTVYQTWRRITEGCNLALYGGEKPEWATYPNGSRVYFAGMDNPQKALSSERDFIYVNQAEELTLDDWETLTTRCSGRAGHVPVPQIYGDANPGPPAHWIRQRTSLRFIESRHEDNPTLYDDAGNLLPGGAARMAVLDALTGIRYQRLRLGKWVQAEGAVYEEWDPAIHLIDRFDVPAEWTRYWCIDFGYTNAFVWQDWAVGPDGQLYRVRELYMTRRIVKDHCAAIWRATQNEQRPQEIICDHDAEDRATFEHEMGALWGSLCRTTAAHKAIKPGIDAVQVRLRPQMTGSGEKEPRIFFLRDSLIERDESLVEARKPFSTEGEFEEYVWPKGVDGKAVKEVPIDDNNHGMDTLRYMVARLDVAAKRMARIGVA